MLFVMILEEICPELVGFGCYVMGFDVVGGVTKHYKKTLGVLHIKSATGRGNQSH